MVRSTTNFSRLCLIYESLSNSGLDSTFRNRELLCSIRQERQNFCSCLYFLDWLFSCCRNNLGSCCEATTSYFHSARTHIVTKRIWLDDFGDWSYVLNFASHFLDALWYIVSQRYVSLELIWTMWVVCWIVFLFIQSRNIDSWNCLL